MFRSMSSKFTSDEVADLLFKFFVNFKIWSDFLSFGVANATNSKRLSPELDSLVLRIEFIENYSL